MKESISQAPPEVLDCLKNNFGQDVVEKIKSGEFMPGRQDGNKMGDCFGRGMRRCSQNEEQRGSDENEPIEGPGGCKNPEECQAFCKDNPDACKNFKGNQMNQRPAEGREEFQQNQPPCSGEDDCRQKFGNPPTSGAPQNFQQPENFQQYRSGTGDFRPPDGNQQYQPRMDFKSPGEFQQQQVPLPPQEFQQSESFQQPQQPDEFQQPPTDGTSPLPPVENVAPAPQSLKSLNNFIAISGR